MKVRVDGQEYELVHNFGNGRGIIDMGGVFPLVDALPVAGEWELSGLPAREHEKPILQKFVDSVKNQTTVTAPDGSTKTYNND